MAVPDDAPAAQKRFNSSMTFGACVGKSLPEAPSALREQPIGIDGLLVERLRVRGRQRDIAETVEDIRPCGLRGSARRGRFRPTVRLRWSS